LPCGIESEPQSGRRIGHGDHGSDHGPLPPRPGAAGMPPKIASLPGRLPGGADPTSRDVLPVTVIRYGDFVMTMCVGANIGGNVYLAADSVVTYAAPQVGALTISAAGEQIRSKHGPYPDDRHRWS
jgi:hypothetical protein